MTGEIIPLFPRDASIAPEPISPVMQAFHNEVHAAIAAARAKGVSDGDLGDFLGFMSDDLRGMYEP